MITPVKIRRRQKKLSSLIGIRGKIVTWTIVRVASKLFFHQAPYPVVIVLLENGQRQMGQLVDYSDENLNVGQNVVSVLRRTGVEDKEGVISYTIKFKPI